MVFKHIVLPGGGPYGITDMGIIFHCIRNNIINLEQVESIHGTSAGGISAVLLCLQNECDIYEDYIVNCMMDKIFYIDPENLVNIFQSKGLVNVNCFKEYFKPFFDSINMSIDITLKEYYTITKKHLYLYGTCVRDVSSVQFSHHQFPDMKLMDALHASCSIPGIFSPIVFNDEVYIDGGLMCNYPLEECLSIENVVPEEVIAVNHVYPRPEGGFNVENFNIFDLIFYLLCCIFEKFISINKNEKRTKIMTEKISRVEEVSNIMHNYIFTVSELTDIFKCKGTRKKFLDRGYVLAKQHFAKTPKKSEDCKI